MAAERLIGRYREWTFLSRNWNNKRLFQVHGIRSVGKSRFVEEFLKFKEDSKECYVKVVPIKVRTVSGVRGICLSLFSALNLSAPEDDTIWTETICSTLAGRGDTDIIIVFDDAENILERESAEEFKQFCKHLIENCRNVKIIITSTTEVVFEDIEEQCMDLLIPPLSPTDSEALLRRYAPSVDFGPHLKTIIELCEGLPLAIAMVASELTGTGSDASSLTVAEMSLALQNCRLEALSQFMYTRNERLDAIYGTFLERLPESMRHKLAMIGYIPGTFTPSHVREMIDDPTVEEAMETTITPLIRRHFLKQDDITQRYDIQGILRNCIDDLLETVKNSPEAKERFCFLFARLMTKIGSMLTTSEYADALCQYNQEQQNFQKLLTNVELVYSNEDMYCLYMEIAVNASNVIQQFMGADGFQFYQELTVLSSKLNRKLDEACVQLCYGGALTNVKGISKEGEAKYRLAIQYLENYRDDPSLSLSGCYHGLRKDIRYHLATSYQRMGWNLFIQGRTSEAIVYLEKAFEFENELKMYTDELILSTLMSLGITHNLSENMSVALRYHEEALRRRKQLYKTPEDPEGERHPAIGSCYNNMGLTYRKMERKDETLYYFKKSLEVKQKTKAPQKSVAISIINVASALSETGKHNEGMLMLRDATAILNKTPNIYQDTKALVYATEGQIMLRKKCYKESIKLFKKSLSIRKHSGPNNFWSGETYNDLAKAYIGLNDSRQALYWLNKVFSLQEELKSDAPTNSFVYDCYVRVMGVLADIGNYDEVGYAFNIALQELQRLRVEFTALGNATKIAWVDSESSSLPGVFTRLVPCTDQSQPLCVQ
ncbi:uncharacterized protein LOC110442765 [Mizuhopecten yessoensis]|uniref:uncharacterized protein LOC110442765 n=1 Tax=Mizuhopecten yessoensis TaxID=6573 RepID=UPI000B45C6A7|nr:uncharacterized protein LOC110442765 [Mizuhopecten yessoensis]XP_021342213.1 uncharacterized protein LOC110442765 [Mizuhopecten yessoensis]XP_021342224.1 uncharacterized protein LOC110442765 [Mizuhopecten yessoensis]XP_021342231.1 uncharacterized protein LOC110442765 [Mizuhopecten yessoensis]XP_021342236.1 uncharacterized protein LOC110442765 [Mizuhopecten yessoensis]XP_021342244.1 uncharacterized protein LOC110442765 [Mizuhopecten yessoensis]